VPDVRLFLYGLLNYAVSSSANIASNDRVKITNELEKMWKETVMTKYKSMSQHFAQGLFNSMLSDHGVGALLLETFLAFSSFSTNI
jgi:hypothetical protein